MAYNELTTSELDAVSGGKDFKVTWKIADTIYTLAQTGGQFCSTLEGKYSTLIICPAVTLTQSDPLSSRPPFKAKLHHAKADRDIDTRIARNGGDAPAC